MLVFREEVDIRRVIATGSPRRRSQLSERFPEVEWKEIRGNVGTRLRKIAEDHEADATILAAARRIRYNTLPFFAGFLSHGFLTTGQRSRR